MNTARQQPRQIYRNTPPERYGPFEPAADPVVDAVDALARGANPDYVARLLINNALRHGRLAEFRCVFDDVGAADAIDAALDAELRARDEAA